MADTEVVYDPRGFLSAGYHDDVMAILKSHWSNIKILMSVWYLKLTLSCVSFTIYQLCHGDIEGDATPTLLQYQNVHWDNPGVPRYWIKLISTTYEEKYEILLKKQLNIKNKVARTYIVLLQIYIYYC